MSDFFASLWSIFCILHDLFILGRVFACCMLLHGLVLPWLICVPVELFEGCDFEKDPKSLQEVFIFDM